ncbi:ComEC/Rec2 family competence protein [Taibaiella koreensis]|uniref:ComEC/Rec2 family competence protein n=1 Tax=Taibaiella koreensis TaxID=1268548 RepID=UPI000E59F4FC|nr:MBL fold metallo-hydrolase [Taibaiella koreensis]
MATIHFLNVLEGDCNIIQHDSGRISMIDVSNAYNEDDTQEELIVKNSNARQEMLNRTNVPPGKTDYGQKKIPDNPIDYLKKLGISNIFRFIITHPDMDHIDGIRDLYSEFNIANTWDTDNNKEIESFKFPYKFNRADWSFYETLRAGKYSQTKRLTYFDTDDSLYWNQDDIKILAPSKELLQLANSNEGNIHDLSYVLLFTPPKKNGGKWKIIFAGDSHDNTWDHILNTYKEEITNVDVLFAPHHGRDSDRDYEFFKVLNPQVTLFGNASSKHLAYGNYNSSRNTRITNNQAGYVILNTNLDRLLVCVKNQTFANYYCNNQKRSRDWGAPSYFKELDAYGLFQITAK